MQHNEVISAHPRPCAGSGLTVANSPAFVREDVQRVEARGRRFRGQFQVFQQGLVQVALVGV